VKECQPSLALLDVGVPVMDGYELARRLREQPGLGGLTVVAVTGYGQEGDRQRSREAGFADHLVNPVSLETLEAILRKLAQLSAT
jgi:CheY-like chemotaxis protein